MLNALGLIVLVQNILYPTRVTSNPTELPIQDADGIPTQDSLGDNLEANQSKTEDRWAAQENTLADGFDDYRYPWIVTVALGS